jgi:hypothetical protein
VTYLFRNDDKKSLYTADEIRVGVVRSAYLDAMGALQSAPSSAMSRL